MEENDGTDNAQEELDSENEEVNFDEHPVGASAEVEETLATGLKESAQQGALARVLEKYNPEEFNSLVEYISEEYQRAQRRKIIFRGATLITSVLLVLSLFAGLMYFVMETQTDGGALIFFAGSLAGYFMRLASELY